MAAIVPEFLAAAATLLLLTACWLVTHPVRYESVSTPVPLPPEPAWKRTHPDAVELPVELLQSLADPLEVAEAKTHRYRVDPLVEAIAAEGQKVPAVIVLDQRGRVRYHDGYHRLVAATELGIETMGVQFTESQVIRGFSRPALQLLHWATSNDAPLPANID